MLTAAGVAFPEGASAHFDPTNSKLIVRNSANSLDIVQSYIEQSSRGEIATLAVSVEIYALSKRDALKLLSEHRNKPDVSDVAKDLQQRVDGDKVKLMASPHFMTRKGVAASIESGEKIE